MKGRLWWKQLLWGLFVLTAVVVVLLLAGCSKAGGEPEPEFAPAPVKTVDGDTFRLVEVDTGDGFHIICLIWRDTSDERHQGIDCDGRWQRYPNS